MLLPWSSLIKRSWKLEADVLLRKPQIKLTFLLLVSGGEKVGEVPHSGGHQLLSFSSILTSVCVAPCRCPFFPRLDTETIPKTVNTIAVGLLSPLGLLPLIVRRALVIKLSSPARTHSSWLPALCSPAGARAIRLALFMQPSLSCQSAAVHSA